MPTSDYFAELLSLNPTGYYKFDWDLGATLFDFTQYARNPDFRFLSKLAI